MSKYTEQMLQNIGKEVNGFKIIGAEMRNHQAHYNCLCSCGNTFWSPLWRIRKTDTCGHDRAKHLALGHKAISDLSVDGTVISSLTPRKVSKNSKTGYTGVCKLPNGQYRAYITFKRKQHSLGFYNTAEDAAAARSAAEKEIYGNFISWYKQNHPDTWQKYYGKK